MLYSHTSGSFPVYTLKRKMGSPFFNDIVTGSNYYVLPEYSRRGTLHKKCKLPDTRIIF